MSTSTAGMNAASAVPASSARADLPASAFTAEPAARERPMALATRWVSSRRTASGSSARTRAMVNTVSPNRDTPRTSGTLPMVDPSRGRLPDAVLIVPGALADRGRPVLLGDKDEAVGEGHAAYLRGLFGSHQFSPSRYTTSAVDACSAAASAAVLLRPRMA